MKRFSWQSTDKIKADGCPGYSYIIIWDNHTYLIFFFPTSFLFKQLKAYTFIENYLFEVLFWDHLWMSFGSNSSVSGEPEVGEVPGELQPLQIQHLCIYPWANMISSIFFP